MWKGKVSRTRGRPENWWVILAITQKKCHTGRSVLHRGDLNVLSRGRKLIITSLKYIFIWCNQNLFIEKSFSGSLAEKLHGLDIRPSNFLTKNFQQKFSCFFFSIVHFLVHNSYGILKIVFPCGNPLPLFANRVLEMKANACLSQSNKTNPRLNFITENCHCPIIHWLKLEGMII